MNGHLLVSVHTHLLERLANICCRNLLRQIGSNCDLYCNSAELTLVTVSRRQLRAQVDLWFVIDRFRIVLSTWFSLVAWFSGIFHWDHLPKLIASKSYLSDKSTRVRLESGSEMERINHSVHFRLFPGIFLSRKTPWAQLTTLGMCRWQYYLEQLMYWRKCCVFKLRA